MVTFDLWHTICCFGFFVDYVDILHCVISCCCPVTLETLESVTAQCLLWSYSRDVKHFSGSSQWHSGLGQFLKWQTTHCTIHITKGSRLKGAIKGLSWNYYLKLSAQIFDERVRDAAPLYAYVGHFSLSLSLFLSVSWFLRWKGHKSFIDISH